MTSRWEFVSGADIEDAYVRQTPLSNLLPVCQAIYLWRRRLVAPNSALHSRDEFVKWLDNTIQVSLGEVCNQHLSHFAVLQRLTIQSQGLTPTKRRALTSRISTPRARLQLARYVQNLAQFSPPLYCGETADLVQRTREHISGDTGFGRRVQQREIPPWPDLELAFFSLGDSHTDEQPRAKELRTLLEMITTAFSVSGYVSRRG